MSRSFWIVIAVLAVIIGFYQMQNADTPLVTVNTLPVPAENEIRVCFLDVGQGDSVLIQTIENAVLIDTGEASEQEALFSYLEEAGVQTLDLLVASHPHNDHVGSMADILEKYNVKKVVMPDAVSATATFEKFLQAIEVKDIPTAVTAAGDRLTAGIITLDVLAPEPDADWGEDYNNASLVLRMVHGDTAFLFTGDAEKKSEDIMLANGYPLRSTILKAGHHGSETASSEAFLDTVKPSVVVISNGKDNAYGHPHADMLARLAARPNITNIYRTDQHGSIIMVSDGTVIKLHVPE
jgi:beta-lactamase superfamily II metal-dependent hydrolase